MRAYVSFVELERLLEDEGILLESARGSVPSVAEFIAGEPIRGSWWGHPAADEIFRVTRHLRDAPEVLVCRLIDGKITFVHRRLWPALVRVADRVGHERLVSVREEHTAGGRHVVHEVPFPQWVPDEVLREAEGMSERDAIDQLPPGIGR